MTEKEIQEWKSGHPTSFIKCDFCGKDVYKYYCSGFSEELTCDESKIKMACPECTKTKEK